MKRPLNKKNRLRWDRHCANQFKFQLWNYIQPDKNPQKFIEIVLTTKNYITPKVTKNTIQNKPTAALPTKQIKRVSRQQRWQH